MRTTINTLALVVVLAIPVQAQELTVRELVESPQPDMAAIERQLTAWSLEGVERAYWRAELRDAAGDVNGTLAPGNGVAIRFPVALDGSTAPEIHQYEFTFSYTPTTEVVKGGLQYQDSTGQWFSPVSEVWGSNGTLSFKVGVLATESDPVGWYFYAHDTDLGGARRAPTLTYRAEIERIDAPTSQPPPPQPTNWIASGTGPRNITIPDRVLRFRVRGTYSGRGENFVVWCGDHRDSDDRGGLLVNEIVGTSYPSDDWTWFTVRNQRSYNGRGQACRKLTLEHSVGVRWEMEQLTSRP